MRQRVFFGTRWSPRGDEDLSSHHIEIEKPGQRPMPDVFELAPEHMARLHRQVGMFALDGLHAGQLIQTDRAFPKLARWGARAYTWHPSTIFSSRCESGSSVNQ